MLETWKVAIPELTGKRHRRKVYVWIPDWVEEDDRLPVLYMFDGHNLFDDEEATYGKSWGLREYMEATGAPLIIVGVECNHSPNHGRLSEYSPFSFREEGIGYVHGRGKITMEWMVNTLKPMIDERYPTLPERENTFIAGSSMGGLMTVYALLQYNHVFSRGAALSPSLWLAGKKVSQLIRDAEIDPDTVLYMDYGEEEFGNHDIMRSAYAQAAFRLMEKGVLLTSRIVPGGRHCEASWEREVPLMMDTLLEERQEWNPPEENPENSEESQELQESEASEETPDETEEE